MTYTVQEIEFATPEYDEMVRLRYDVLRKPLGREFTEEQLAAEYADALFGIYDAHNNLLGCLIMTEKNSETVKMRQVAVSANAQGKGIGSEMVSAVEHWSRHKNYKNIKLNAREVAVNFYKNLGYTVVGEPFEEVGIPHSAMIKQLAKN